jgi:hypothetical protein
MNTYARLPIFSVSLLAAALAWSTSAWAPGSLSLDEVLQAVKMAPKLVSEITSELNKNGLKAESVFCVGARHGRQWTYLGGMRSAPYSCKIGNRELTI